MSLKNVAVQTKTPASTMRQEQKKHKNQILELRQKIYSNLKENKNVSSMMKIFKSKVEKFMKDYRTDLSYDEEKCWRDKVIITEKAVDRREKELKALKESSRDENVAPPPNKSMVGAHECSECKDKNTVPSVKKVFDNVKAQERAIENLPDPPQVDDLNDIERRLKKLKKFNTKRLVDRKDGERKVEVKIAKGNPEVFEKNLPVVDKVNVTVAAGKTKENAGTSGDVDTIVKNANIFDMNVKGSTKSQDNDMNMMYKQVHGGETYEDRVDSDKGMDALKIIPLLQAILIFATLLFSDISRLSQPSLHSHTQPKVSRFLSSPCSCQTQSVCCKVSSAIIGNLLSTASAGVAWLKRTFYGVKKRMRSCALDWVRILVEGL